jgi:hypothetical protein
MSGRETRTGIVQPLHTGGNKQMTVLSRDATKAFLNWLNRWSRSDRDFSWFDIGWTNDAGEQLAVGWFGWSNGQEIANVGADQSSSVYPEIEFNFDGDDAYALRYCGESSHHTENSAPLPPRPGDDEHAHLTRPPPRARPAIRPRPRRPRLRPAARPSTPRRPARPRRGRSRTRRSAGATSWR